MSSQAFLDGYLSKEAGDPLPKLARPATPEEVSQKVQSWRDLWTGIATRARPALSSTPNAEGRYAFPGGSSVAGPPPPVPWELRDNPRVSALLRAKQMQYEAETNQEQQQPLAKAVAAMFLEPPKPRPKPVYRPKDLESE